MAGDKTLETKSIRIVMDPGVTMTVAERARWNAILMDLHELQRRGSQSEAQLSTLFTQMQDAVSKFSLAGGAPSSVKTQFETLRKDLDAVRVKFGVGPSTDTATAAAAGGRGGRGGGGAGGGRGGGRGGGGGGGGANDEANLLARAGTVKGAIGGIWEMPSDLLVKRHTDVKAGLSAAIVEANAVIAKANALAPALKQYSIEIGVGR
jgi:hypothetical protein